MFQNQTSDFLNTNQNTLTELNHNVSIQFKVEIVSLILQETGTYNDHYTRSYKASMSHDTINDLVASVVHSNMNTRGTALSSIASGILDVTGRVKESDLIQIPNGWGTRRFRFMLQVRETSVLFPDSVYYTYLQGFTETQDVSLQTRQINPEMRFFINSFFRIQEYVAATPNGPKTSQRVVNSGQIVNGALVADKTGFQPTLYMRPSDVIGKIQTDADAELRSGDVFDIRNTNIGGSNSVLNNFGNNTATNYLSRLLTPMIDSIKSIGFGPGHNNYIDTATSNSIGAEPAYSDSPFMTLLTRRFNMIGAGSFTMNELAAIDPTVGSRTTLTPVENRWSQGLSSRGNSELWETATSETIMATKLVNAIPGLMWQSYIGSASFSMTNSFTGGKVELSFSSIKPITNFAPPEYVKTFIMNMEEIVARDISYNSQMSFSVFVNASIIGDVQLNVSINGGPSVPYVAPAFGSGVLNPVYTHDQQGFNNFADGMRSVMDGLQSVYNEASDFSGNGSLNPLI